MLRRHWTQTALPCGPRAFAHGSGMGLCGTWIRVCLGSANRVRLLGYRKPRALHLGPTFQLQGPHPGVLAAAQGRLQGALGAASQQAPLELTGWWRLFQQAARRLLALPTQMPALLAPHTPLWLGVIQPQLWTQVLLLLLVQVQALPVRLQLHLLAPLQLPLQSAQFLCQLGPLLPPTPSRGLPASNNSNCLSPC